MSGPKTSGEPRVVLVVAAARNGVIGSDGAMPWRLSTDLKRFKALTMGKPIIMGRKTFQSIGKALPGRRNIVITRDAGFSAPDVEAVASVEAALSLGRNHALTCDVNEICVIGGGEIYRQALPVADRVYLTRVECQPDGDTYFPQIDENIWVIEEESAHAAGANDDVATRFVIYRRKAA
ncbi:MAG: dihydrofolate reductase [Rhizobiaceae bacterium]|nr:dihydrofolate reductase [Rhizobiaceae bacterium]